MENIRWKQRFGSYSKALFQLESALQDYNQLTNESLKEKIDKRGQLFFERQLNRAL